MMLSRTELVTFFADLAPSDKGSITFLGDDATHPMHNQGWVVARGWTGTSQGPLLPNTTTPRWTYDAADGDFIMIRYFAGFFAAFTDMTIENANTELEQVVACLNHLIYECLYGKQSG